jgi:hypothetical protein
MNFRHTVLRTKLQPKKKLYYLLSMYEKNFIFGGASSFLGLVCCFAFLLYLLAF